MFCNESISACREIEQKNVIYTAAGAGGGKNNDIMGYILPAFFI
jgi:hypothetical protein